MASNSHLMKFYCLLIWLVANVKLLSYFSFENLQLKLPLSSAKPTWQAREKYKGHGKKRGARGRETREGESPSFERVCF